MDTHELTELLRDDDEIITSRLAHWAAVGGDRPFFHYGEGGLTLTFAEFARTTDSIAGNLTARGVHKGDRVSVFSADPLVSALAMFGAWKAGALYCPVNFAYTGPLLEYQLTDTAPGLVITDAELLPVLDPVIGGLPERPAVVAAGADVGGHIPWSELTADAPAPGVTVSFDDLANVVYTSGTTGPAKGVVQTYRWMAQYTFLLRALLTRDDVIYNDLPMYHVGGAIANVARAAWVGCEVAVWNRFSPNDFWARIRARNATTAILLDVMIPWLESAPPSDDDRRNTLNKVHMQPLPAQHHAFAWRFGIDFVTAGFGQTESGAPLGTIIEEVSAGEGTPAQLYRGMSHDDVGGLAERYRLRVLPGAAVGERGFMGWPVPFAEATVLDTDDHECPVGQAGQLAFRPRLPGIFLHSYLGKPEATLAAFRNLWFHTGDAAVRSTDGAFRYVDRLGDRMRVRGENLSSFQVEELLQTLAAVKLCAVFAIPSEQGDEDAVVAYVVPGDGEMLSAQEVIDHAAATMPKFMRPHHVRIVDDLPRTPTNKIEKYKLRTRILDELRS